MVVDVSENHWRVNFYNPAMLRLLGLPSGKVSNQDGEPLIFRIAGTAGVDAVRNCNSDCPQTQFASEYISAHAEDRHIDGEVVALTGYKSLRAVFFRVSARDKNLSQTGSTASLRMLATDAVSTFLKPAPWLELLQRDAAIAAREQSWLAVIAFRVDALQAYIETFGQHAGDSAMKRIAHSIRRRLKRAGDTAARMADDEIAVMVHGSSGPTAREFAASIAEDVRALAIHHPKSPIGRHITVSVGVCALVPGGENDADDMLTRARAQLDTPDTQQVVAITGNLTTH